MYPIFPACFICGIEIYSYNTRYAQPWARQYRAIYRDGDESRITGVGRHDGGASWTAPYGPLERWDHAPVTVNLLVLSAMTQRPVNGRRGFVLHDDCWHLLQRASTSGPVSISRLLEACESLPFPLPTNTVFWGHDYGGLWTLDIGARSHPREELHDLRRETSDIYWDGLESPLDVPCISEMLSTRSKPPFDSPLIKASHDLFGVLPWEILEDIAIRLATRDALQLRHASASFLPLYISSAFWASRFSADGERGFLFERNGPRDYLEWITLYKLSKLPSQIPALSNRHRVWNLARLVVNATQRYCAESLPVTAKAECSREPSVRVSCEAYLDDGNERLSHYYKPCRSFGTSVVTLHVDLMQVGVTVINMGVCTYVAGLRFIAKDQPDIKVGYVADREDQILTISELRGFKVAKSASGIRALQIVGSDGESTKWAGDPAALPVSDCCFEQKPVRSVSKYCFKQKPVCSVEIEIDGFKIIGLGID